MFLPVVYNPFREIAIFVNVNTFGWHPKLRALFICGVAIGLTKSFLDYAYKKAKK